MKQDVITKIVVSIMLGGLMSSLSVAQNGNNVAKDFSFIKETVPWLTSKNSCGLCFLPVNNVSVARISFNKGNGGFVNYYQSENSYNIGVETESFYRLGSNVFLYGKVLYDYFEGNNMGGSAFIDPLHAPFNFVEFSDTTCGNKEKEIYDLAGGISVGITKKLSLGGKIEYKSGNYAKSRDLRHVNSLLDMSVGIGMLYRFSPHFYTGANYYYRKNVEVLYFNVLGTTEKRYNTLIDYGAFYGFTEEYGDSGYMSSSSSEKKPLVSYFHGGVLQFNFNFNENISFLNEIDFNYRGGYYGVNSTAYILYSEHNGINAAYSGTLSVKKKLTSGKYSLHIMNINALYENIINKENIYQQSSVNGVTITKYFGSNQVLDKNVMSGSLGYTLNSEVSGYIPKWKLSALLDGFYRNQSVSVYPFYRKQKLFSAYSDLSGTRNITSGNNIYSVSVGAGYGLGKGTIKEDGTYTAPSEEQKTPKSMEIYLEREFEYLTAARIKTNIGFKYSHIFKNRITGYIDLNYRLYNAFKIRHLTGGTHHGVSLTLGCSF